MKKTADLRSSSDQILIFVLAIVLCATALWAIGCGGGGGAAPTTPSTTPSGPTVGATVTITSSGLSNQTPRINSGERIRFTNNDTRAHEILTTPHLIHTDCPGLNSIGSIAPGQSGTSDALTGSRGCGFHDHLNPDNNGFRGQVLVGLSSTDPTPPDPYYVR